MNDDIIEALLTRLESLAVSNHQIQSLADERLGELAARHEHILQLKTVAKDGQERLSAAKAELTEARAKLLEAADRITGLELEVEAAQAREKLAPTLRVETITARALASRFEVSSEVAATLLDYLRQPVGGAS